MGAVCVSPHFQTVQQVLGTEVSRMKEARVHFGKHIPGKLIFVEDFLVGHGRLQVTGYVSNSEKLGNLGNPEDLFHGSAA
jgi:hypothetical protein